MKRAIIIFLAVFLAFVVATSAGADKLAIIYLKDQPFPAIARDLRVRSAQAITELDQEARFARKQNNNERLAAATRRIGNTIAQTNQMAINQARSATFTDQEAIANAVVAAGGRVVYRYGIVNALAVSIPDDAVQTIEKLPQISRIAPSRVLTPQLNISVPSLFAPTIWNEGYTGGEWRAAVLDTGVNTSHTGLVHQWTSRVFHEAAMLDPLYADDPNNSSSIHYHGTSVAGPIGSMNQTYRGVSYGVTRMINLKAGYKMTDGGGMMQDQDMMAAIDWAISESEYPPNVLNFSFAGEYGLEDSDLTRYWDSVVDCCQVSAAIAAGNDTGPEKVFEPSIGYNVLSVGAVFDGGTVDRSDDVIASFSSWGPTVQGRKKPDIVAPGGRAGSGIILPSSGGSYGPGNGTSYAAPHISGCLVLLGDIGVSNPKAQKAILLTTAEDKGAPGWDQRYGWGLADLAAAYACAAGGNYAVDSVGPEGGGDCLRYYRFATTSSGKATLVWNRHVEYNATEIPETWHPLNDLDLFLYREDSNDLLASSESRIDNVEQVFTSSPLADGVVKVKAYSNEFNGVEQEEFAVAGNAALEPVQGPKLEIDPLYLTFTPGGSAVLTITVRNTGGLNAHDVRVAVSSSILQIDGANPNTIGMIPPGGTAKASWAVSAENAGVYIVSCTVDSNSYGESINAADDFSIYVSDSIGTVKLQEDDVTVGLTGKIVTAAIGSEAWIEEWNRSSALKIIGLTGLSPGNVIQVEGELGSDCSGRYLTADTGSVIGQTVPPEPVFMSTREIGGGSFGGYLPGVYNGFGLNNLGMLVKIAGKVTHSTDTEFYVDDGSALDENLGPIGIKVISRGLVKPTLGEMVSVTGIVSANSELMRGCVRCLLIRDSVDVQEL